MQMEKEQLELKAKLAREGVLNSTTDAVGGAVTGVVGGAGKLAVGAVGFAGSGVGMVGGGLLKGGKAITRGLTRKSSRTDVNGTNGSVK